MAKAEDIEVDPFESYAAAGARIVQVRARELFEHADGVLDTGDIERVHAMRVASRRLRAVLEVFAPCFPAELYAPVLRDVKRLADALGERRDPDVHIEAMERFSAGLSAPQRRGVATLIARLRDHQAAGNEALAAALEGAERSELAARLQALATTAEPEALEADPDEAEPGEAEALAAAEPELVASTPVTEAPAR